jgi:predicted negative regulator of RcsB-dependent stress response
MGDIILIALVAAVVGVAGYMFYKKRGIAGLIDAPAILEKFVDQLEGHVKELDGDTAWERAVLAFLDKLDDHSPLLEKAVKQLREGKASYAIKNLRKAIDEMRAKAGK